MSSRSMFSVAKKRANRPLIARNRTRTSAINAQWIGRSEASQARNGRPGLTAAPSPAWAGAPVAAGEADAPVAAGEADVPVAAGEAGTPCSPLKTTGSRRRTLR